MTLYSEYALSLSLDKARSWGFKLNEPEKEPCPSKAAACQLLSYAFLATNTPNRNTFLYVFVEHEISNKLKD